MTGRTILHYRILGELGEGGMSVVYLAEDVRLGRRVAIKFLPHRLAETSEGLERFAREARTASSLNHPNICTLYDIGEEDGRPFIVMELLEGETLKERLDRGPVRISELVEWGVQIADALEAAHAQNIVHRDIKPGNLFITTRGQAKVLDFGLAKLVHARHLAGAGAGNDATRTMLDDFESTPGSAAGTIGYMSPEQARGEAVDSRSDLFSFGAVLYEMATGQEPFPGVTSAVVFDAILNREPESALRLNPDVPVALEGIIRKALEKEPRYRYQTAGDMATDLQRLKRDSSSGSRAAAAIPRRRSKTGFVAAASVFGLAILVAAGVWLRKRAPAPVELVPVKVTANPSDLPIRSAILSRDGKYLAYSDRLGIYVLAFGSGDARLLPDTAGLYPADWSRDSTELYALRNPGTNDWTVMTVSLLGGAPRAGPRGLPSPDLRYLVTPHFGIEAADGGKGLPMYGVSPDRVTGFQWSPDSQRVALSTYQPTAQRLFLLEVFEPAAGKRATLLRTELPIVGVVWLSNLRLAYAKMEPGPPFMDFNLWSADLDRTTDGLRGEPRRLSKWTGFSVSELSATSDGKKLAFIKEDSQSDVYVGRFEAGGTRLATPQRLTLDDRSDNPTAWLPDNRTILFESDRSGKMQVFQQRLDSTSAEVLLSGPAEEYQPRLTPDGRFVLYVEAPYPQPKHTHARLMRAPVAGGGSPEQVLVSDDNVRSFQCSFAAPGACLINELRENEEIVSQFDPVVGRGKVILRNPIGVGDAAMSPDGRHIALAAGQPRNRIRVLKMDGAIEKEFIVSAATRIVGLDWSADGRSFYCGDVSRNISSLLRVEPDGKSQILWSQTGQHDMWGVPSRDGKYLAIHGVTESANVWTVDNPRP